MLAIAAKKTELKWLNILREPMGTLGTLGVTKAFIFFCFKNRFLFFKIGNIYFSKCFQNLKSRALHSFLQNQDRSLDLQKYLLNQQKCPGLPMELKKHVGKNIIFQASVSPRLPMSFLKKMSGNFAQPFGQLFFIIQLTLLFESIVQIHFSFPWRLADFKISHKSIIPNIHPCSFLK